MSRELRARYAVLINWNHRGTGEHGGALTES